MEWRPIPEWESLYEVSDTGLIRRIPGSLTHGGLVRDVLAAPVGKLGYRLVTLSSPGRSLRNWAMHRFVALAFIGPRDPDMEVNHKNGDKLDNSVANLEYVPHRRNCQHAYELGLNPIDKPRLARGEAHVHSRLTAECVGLIRKSKESNQILGKRFGVSPDTI